MSRRLSRVPPRPAVIDQREKRLLSRESRRRIPRRSRGRTCHGIPRNGVCCYASFVTHRANNRPTCHPVLTSALHTRARSAIIRQGTATPHYPRHRDVSARRVFRSRVSSSASRCQFHRGPTPRSDCYARVNNC